MTQTLIEAIFEGWTRDATKMLPRPKEDDELARLACEVRVAFLVMAEAHIALAGAEASSLMRADQRPMEFARSVAQLAHQRALAAAARLRDAQTRRPA